ncbi:DUF6138 family protein [Flavobacterium ardleyense]|uniref:DUF6138 family protein n=1 Tax=Flavobacterium ardleyense TaxID=2038737 RepID=A0ABW5Z4P7_9FLAO
MSRQLDYLVEIKGNELLLERFIDAINNNTCKTAKEYPEPYLLVTGEKFLNSRVIDYFFESRPFDKNLYIDFFEKLRKLESRGFNNYSYTIGLWIEKRITKKFFKITGNDWDKVKTLDSNLELSFEEIEILNFICYVAVCHIKYGASYETVTAKEYFDIVTQLGSKEVVKLKKEGTGKLPKNITHYKDNDLTCDANDVFATVKIKMKNENEEAYHNALIFINKLLKTDFPKSFEINFSPKTKELLPLKGLPKCGQNYLFANAVKYQNLHPEIAEYINLAKHKWEWYINLEDENCAMPSTFAVFALGLNNEKYFDVLIDYFQTVAEEHQSIQEKFTPVFLDKFGINDRSIKVYISCILSMQEHPHNKAFISYFTNEKNLNLLMESKAHFSEYYFTEENLKDYSDSGNDVQEMADYCWESVIYTTFGQVENFDKITKQLTEKEIEIFNKLRTQ